MKPTKNNSRWQRVVLYVILSLGLAGMTLFRSRLGQAQSWGTSWQAAGQKLLLFLGIFAVLELLYTLIAWLRQRR